MRPDLRAAIRARIRDIPDFPSPGIVFKDITPLLGDAGLLALSVESMAAPWRGQRVTHVAAPESRGFVFGAPVAIALGAGFVPLRKRGKLPWRTRQQAYALEYGVDVVEAHEDAVGPGARVRVVDDVLATGGTAEAACRLMESLGATVVGLSMLMSLDFLAGRERLAGRRVEALVRYA
ncbi:MAG: adenine phosphoribosyltransferase [Gemmatimonadota bacterium]